jgi:hypothetical protein
MAMAMAMAVEGQNARHKRNTYLQHKVNETLLLPHKSAPPPLLLPTHDAKVREREMHACMHAPPPLSNPPTNPLASLFFSLNPLKMVLECEFCFCRFFSCYHFQFYFLLGFFLVPSFFGERKLFLVCCRVLSSLLCIHFIMPELFICSYNFLVETQLWKKIKLNKIKLPEYSSSKLLLNVVVILAPKCEEQIV